MLYYLDGLSVFSLVSVEMRVGEMGGLRRMVGWCKIVIVDVGKYYRIVRVKYLFRKVYFDDL